MDAPAEKYATVHVRAYETKNKNGKVTGYKWRAVLPYRKEDGEWTKKTITLTTEGRDKGRSKQIEKAAQNEAETLRKRLNAEESEELQLHETVAEYFSRYVEGRALSIER